MHYRPTSGETKSTDQSIIKITIFEKAQEIKILLEKLDRIEAHLQTVDTDIKELKNTL